MPRDGQAVIANEHLGTFDPLLAPDGDILVAIGDSGGTGTHTTFQIWGVSEAGLALGEDPVLGELLPVIDPVGGFIALPDGFYLLLGGSEDSFVKASFDYFGAKATEPPKPPLYTEGEWRLPDDASDTEGIVAAQPDGELVLAGSAPLPHGEQGIFLERLRGASAPAMLNLPPHVLRRGPRGVTLRLSCTRARTCNGLAELSGTPRLRYATSKTFTIGPGHSQNVTLTFTAAGRRRFSKHARTRVKLTLILNDGPEQSASITLPAKR